MIRILLIFIDGLGIGADDSAVNPLARYPDIWVTSVTEQLRSDLAFKSLDACLGVEGLPQSATGQTALLTGINAPRLLGRHLQGFPSKQLIRILQSESIFVKLKRCGRRGFFANAYRHPEDIAPTSRLSVTSHAYRAGGQSFQTLDHARAGQALYHDFTHRVLKEEGYDVPLYNPEQAAEILIHIATKHDFTLYEHFLTDILAHRGDRAALADHARSLSVFIRTALDLVDTRETALLITSDHGNLEDVTVRTHTRRPVPFIWTKNAPLVSQPAFDDITGVTPWILAQLGCNLQH